MAYISVVAQAGRGRWFPLDASFSNSCDDWSSANGMPPWVRISQHVNPNDQTSEAVENSSDLNDSGAIHLQGRGI